MHEVFTVLKGLLDPLFIAFVLLIISFIVFLLNCKKKSDSLILLLAIIFLYGASIAPVANHFCYYLEKDYIQKSADSLKSNVDVIVVLGSGTREINSMKETFNTEMESARVTHAVAVYNKTGAKYFVCSGKSEGKISQAEAMAKLAESLGVPGEKIKIEPNSRNTSENAVGVHEMFGNKNLNIGLVTSAFHMARSEREFKKYFNNVQPLPAHYLYSSPVGNAVLRYFPQSEELYKTSVAFREMVAQLWYRLK
jgi:uncharacterized SAM-binding protein YcdF (DUF218 family)